MYLSSLQKTARPCILDKGPQGKMLVETIPSSTRLEQQEVVHAGNGLPGCFPSTSSKESMGHSKNVMSKELVLCCDPAMW